jgi:hypothetical protein
MNSNTLKRKSAPWLSAIGIGAATVLLNITPAGAVDNLGLFELDGNAAGPNIPAAAPTGGGFHPPSVADRR